MKLLLPLYVGIILQKDGKVFPIKRANTNWQEGAWNFPGELVEVSESVLQAALRETEEEVGIRVAPEDFSMVHLLRVRRSETNAQDIVGCYITASRWHGVARNNKPEKLSDAQWFAIDDLPQFATEHAQLAVRGLDESRHYSEHGWQ